MNKELEQAKKELDQAIDNKCTFEELIEKSINIDNIVATTLNNSLKKKKED